MNKIILKNKFIKGTLILIIGGMLTKGLGFLIKIIYTRIITEQGVGLYSLVMPTYSLFISLAILALPTAVSTVIAKNKYSSKKVFFSIIPFIIVVNIILILIIFTISPYLANNLLKNPDTYYPLISIAFVLPFISTSSLIKGYFFGKQKMFPYALSNVIEQIIRLILIVIFLPYLMKLNIVWAVTGVILLSVFSEISSIIIYLFFLPKNFKITLNDIKPDLNASKDVLNISIPTVSSRLIGNISFFFEPIILTFVLTKIGYSNQFIVSEYGAYMGYVLPLLIMPSFFVQAIQTAIVPEISKYYHQNNLKLVKKRFKEALTITFILGMLANIFILLFGNSILNIIYNTKKGLNYLNFLTPFFILFYLEGPIIATLQAINKAKISMIITIIGSIIKLGTMTILSFFHIGIYGLIISEIVNILFVVILNYLYLTNYIN